jgi:hypothetical protein
MIDLIQETIMKMVMVGGHTRNIVLGCLNKLSYDCHTSIAN